MQGASPKQVYISGFLLEGIPMRLAILLLLRTSPSVSHFKLIQRVSVESHDFRWKSCFYRCIDWTLKFSGSSALPSRLPCHLSWTPSRLWISASILLSYHHLSTSIGGRTHTVKDSQAQQTSEDPSPAILGVFEWLSLSPASQSS